MTQQINDIQYIDSLTEKVREQHAGEKYLIYTHGCQMNEHDSEKIAWLFDEMGYESTELEDAL